MTNSETPWEIDVHAVKARLDAGDDFLLLDCREQDEHQIARIADALLLPMSELGERSDELLAHQGRHVVVLCHHGGRSLRLARWLRQQGFPTAQSMAGGINAWAIEIDSDVPRY